MAVTLLTNLPDPANASSFENDATNIWPQLNTSLNQFNNDISLLNFNSTTDTSLTSNSIGTGSKTFIVSTGKSFVAGMYLNIVDSAAPTSNGMICQVTSYSGSTLVVNSINFNGSGTISSWVISIGSFVSSSSGVSTQGYKNVIINGDMVVAQRGTSFTGIATTQKFTLDRWAVSQQTSNTITAAQDTDVPTSKLVGSSLSLTVTGTADTSIAAGDFSILRYVCEGYDARRFCGKTFTISFWVKSSLTGAYHISLVNAGADRSYLASYTISAANTWEKKIITVTNGLAHSSGSWNLGNGNGFALSFALACGSTFQNATTNAWVTGNFIATSSQVNFVGTVSNVFKITDVQIELGAIATDFEQLPFDQQLERCRRYYEKSYNVGDAIGSVTTSGETEFGQILGAVSSANHSIRNTIPYLVSKRTGAPTVTLYSPATGTSNRVRHLNTASPADITPTITAYGERAFSFEVSQATTFTDLRYSAHWVSDAEL